MASTQHPLLNSFIQSLGDIRWFAHAGEPHPTAIVASDLVQAWDQWNGEMLAVWSPETHALERIAVAELGDSEVDAIFEAVSGAVDVAVRDGMERYFERRSFDVTNADRGLWPDWLDTVKRDLSWAAVEAVLGRSGYFSSLLPYYRAGRWPCAWESDKRSGRIILL
jgi:hypothetical protein